MSQPEPVSQLGICPDCGTDLTAVRGRAGSRYVWCWKCERALRPGERHAAACPYCSPRPDVSQSVPNP